MKGLFGEDGQDQSAPRDITTMASAAVVGGRDEDEGLTPWYIDTTTTNMMTITKMCCTP